MKGLSVFFWFFPDVQVHKGITIVLSLFRSHWLAVMCCLVLCSGSCGLVHKDRTLFLVTFFPSKLPEFLHVLFNLVLKHPPCILLPVFFFFFFLMNKNSKNKFLLFRLVAFIVHALIFCPVFFFRHKVQTSLRNTGKCLTTKLKRTKNSGTGKSPKKTIWSVCHQAIQLLTFLTGKMTKIKTISCPEKPSSR